MVICGQGASQGEEGYNVTAATTATPEDDDGVVDLETKKTATAYSSKMRAGSQQKGVGANYLDEVLADRLLKKKKRKKKREDNMMG